MKLLAEHKFEVLAALALPGFARVVPTADGEPGLEQPCRLAVAECKCWRARSFISASSADGSALSAMAFT